MKAFATLYTTLDASTATHDKHNALRAYFNSAAPADAAWAAYFLSGGKPRQVVPTRVLRTLAQQRAHLPEWLFDECYHTVGDLAETIAHVLPPPTSDDDTPLSVWITDRLLPLRGAAPETIEQALLGYWDSLDWSGRFLLTKLIGGGFRVGVSRQLVIRALADIAGIDQKRIAHRMVGWTDTKRTPTAARFLALIAKDAVLDKDIAGDEYDENTIAAADTGHPGSPSGATQSILALVPSASPVQTIAAEDLGLPYPFFLAQPLQGDIDTPESVAGKLGERADWQAEWKWDGIRTQLVKRGGQAWLWSRGEDLITDRFPEITATADALPDGTVLDGEIVAWAVDAPGPAPFSQLQPRITRKTVSKKILADAPARYLVYDLLEQSGQDLREVPLATRRAALETLLAALLTDGRAAGPSQRAIALPSVVTAPDWAALAALRAESRSRGVEGMMLKHRQSRYGVGRTRADGEWYKWKVAPYTVDAVLLYAQAGHGRRANLYTDYTFAVWDGPPEQPSRALVPFTKAYSGLTDAEIKRVDAIVRNTTIEKFGPVRSVRPTLLFEIAFEGIARSPRHKSGIAVRFPRMLRWREDKPIEEGDTLASLQALLPDAVALPCAEDTPSPASPDEPRRPQT
ncbi:DNA ligase-1 [Robbsia andropogonis]|uniref:cisplatin damage response ATP-dependent DNA ligase n=1 Tax=Robbsia andropogonis TaxID=28092 RepID=UPI00209F18D2|nr:cisplatin damage response ATP-dependent DNA ligase [Robbsia andropogonis]MCP1116975.1 cisplatin damage response ATP-dependent DNA ligase [Robbsia andropogonis]MCP1126346.1 cisplatin damage response ATP-dependent DNA ligase [Robbsia andropogonis]